MGSACNKLGRAAIGQGGLGGARYTTGVWVTLRGSNEFE